MREVKGQGKYTSWQRHAVTENCCSYIDDVYRSGGSSGGVSHKKYMVERSVVIDAPQEPIH